MIDLDAIEAAALAATPGPWEWHTGCSWRRLSTVNGEHTGDVLRPYNAKADGHPDCAVSEANMRHIATMDPQTTLALVERVRELEELEERALALQADWENGSDEDMKMGVGRVVDWLRAREASGWKWVDRLSWRRKA